MKTEYTATTAVLSKGRALLLWHEKLRSYLPPGGHIESDETPEEAAVRECLEETGLKVHIVPAPHVLRFSLQEPRRVMFHPQPHLVLIHQVPYVETPKQYVDFVFHAIPATGEQEPQIIAGEWFTAEDIEAMGPEKIFPQVRDYLLAMIPLSYPYVFQHD